MRKKVTNEGFISVTTGLVIGVLVILLGGGTYFGSKYVQTLNEDSELREQIKVDEGGPNPEIEMNKIIEKDITKDIKDPEVNLSGKELQAEIDAAVQEALAEQDRSKTTEVYVAPPTISENTTTEEEVIENAEKESEKIKNNTGTTFTVTQLTQTRFEENSFTYGGFLMQLSIKAIGGDIYIPMSTTDSAHGTIGFPYSITGSEFRGFQDSKVQCSLRSDGRCKVKENNSSDITVIVWLSPEEPGNYAVKFNEVNYFQNGEEKTFSLGDETGALYLY